MSDSRITVHLVAQAHLDPVWLWPWQAGVDETLATCRTACDLLDDYPEFIFNKGEAWGYAQVERLDPALFKRIVRHVKNGRWEIVGGWWLQPDCNLPSGFGMERQIEIGKRYFLDKFGVFPETGYNVDSFGHAATLPGYMRAAGQRYYVMMRPQEHEMALPARLFRWRGYEKGDEVLTFRIAGAYCTGPIPNEDHIKRAVSDLPEGVAHTMCFVGVGDHGGGASVEMIKWVKKHETAIEGCRIVFSSPSRFFAAVGKDIRKLPVVTGELQHHAIGCYTAQRGIKTRIRKAEHLLREAETVLPAKGAEKERAAVDDAWSKVCFNQFHDIMGGSCVPSAYAQCYDQLGHAAMVGDESVQYELRRRCAKLPDDPLQRIVFLNAPDAAFDGYTEFDPWLLWQTWNDSWRLLDEKGREVPCQSVKGEAIIGPDASTRGRLLFRTIVEAGDIKVLRIDKSGNGGDSKLPAVAEACSGCAWTDGAAIHLDGASGLEFAGKTLPLPRLDLLDDLTDNWSHGVDRYPVGSAASALWNASFAACSGPLMSSLWQTGRIGESRLEAEWRVYAGESFVELRLKIDWRERRKILKLVLDLPGKSSGRVDGIMGGSLSRANDGAERPLRDWTQLKLARASGVGVVCPDVYALDATEDRVRFTLLRSAIMSHHEPNRGMAHGAAFMDQGEHEFRFRFFMGKSAGEGVLERHAMMLQRPLIGADLTKGMPRRF